MSRSAASIAAHGSAVLAAGYAAVSAYWTAGGTALLATVGGPVEDLARRGDATAVVVGVVTVLLKVAGAVLALALVRPGGRRLLTLLAGGAGTLLVLYGGVNVLLGGLGLLGVFGPPDDPVALRWHVGVWDLWFLLWGLLLLSAVVLRRRDARPVGPRV